jgi:hypothetical protein
MSGIMPFVGRTQQEAEDKFAQLPALLHPAVGIGMLIVDHFLDLSGYDLDSPVPEIAMTNDQMGPGLKTSAREPEFTWALMDQSPREELTIRQLFDVISAGFWSLGVIETPAADPAVIPIALSAASLTVVMAAPELPSASQRRDVPRATDGQLKAGRDGVNDQRMGAAPVRGRSDSPGNRSLSYRALIHHPRRCWGRACAIH